MVCALCPLSSGGGPGLHLRQSRFLSKGPPTPEEDDKLWYVGVCATTGTPGSKDIQTLKTFPLSTKEATAEHFVVPEGGWIRLNAGNTGIFRVNYTPPLWEALATAVATMSLPVIDRLGTPLRCPSDYRSDTPLIDPQILL